MSDIQQNEPKSRLSDFRFSHVTGFAFDFAKDEFLRIAVALILFIAFPAALIEEIIFTKFEVSETWGSETNFLLVIVYQLVRAPVVGFLCLLAFQYYTGQRRHAMTAIVQLLPLIPGLVAMHLIIMIGVGIGFLMLVIPGIILTVMLYVASPAYAIERIGISTAMSRSAELTKGMRWRTLLVFVLSVVLLLPFAFLPNFVWDLTTNGVSYHLQYGIYLISYYLLDAIETGISTLLMLGLYFELARIKNGPPSEQTARVFE